MSLLKPINKPCCLHSMCETNYFKLFRLAPNLLYIKDSAVAYANGKPALHLKVIDKTAYTLTLELSHCFEHDTESFFEPAVKIRAYLDAKTAEVLRDHVRSPAVYVLRKYSPSHANDLMDYKWSLNYFLEKWLNHCLQSDYQFEKKRNLHQKQVEQDFI